VRVYRTDGSFVTVQCQLTATTTDVVAIMTAKTGQTKTGYKLFIREKASGTCLCFPPLKVHTTS
jgi:hypothetical protein